MRLSLPALAAAFVLPVLVHGTATAATPPDIELHRTDVSGVDIPDGGTFAMGATAVGVPFVQYLAVGNTSGTDPLHLTSVTAPAGFTITQMPALTIAGGASYGLYLRCDAAAPGTYTGNLVLVSDDPDESPFEVALSCTVTAASGTPTIRIADRDGVPLPDGGDVTLAPGTSKLLRIHNDQGGDGPLILATPQITPAGPWVPSYISDDVVAVDGMSMYFVIRCGTGGTNSSPAVTGDFTVSIASNATGAANPYTFSLHCTETSQPPATDPPSTDPAATDPVATNPPGTNPPGTNPPGTVPPSSGPAGAGGGPNTGRGLPSTGAAGAAGWMALALVASGVAATAAARRQRNVTR